MKCPACGSNNIHRDGTYADGTQRYKCDTCSKVMRREGFMRDNQLKAQRLLQGPTEKVSWDSISEYSAPMSTTSYTSSARERSKTKMPSFMQGSKLRSSGRETNKIVMAHNLKFPLDITNQVISILGIRGSGKCLHGESRIALEDGRYVKINDLKDLQDMKVCALNTDTLKMKNTVWDKFYVRTANDLMKLTLSSGKTIKATSEHPLLTLSGWKSLGSLKSGDRIATPRKIDAWGDKSIGEHRAALLGHIISEGSISHQKKIEYANMLDWFREIGIQGCDSYSKFVPECIMTAPKNETSVFLNRLFSGDGTIRADRVVVSYTSVSERLIDEIQFLLLKFGIHSRKGIKNGTYKGENHKSWRLNLYSDNAVKFCKEINFIHPEKYSKSKQLITKFNSTNRNPNSDTIPQDIWDIIVDETEGSDLTQSEVILSKHADSDIFWDKIVKIEEIEGEHKVFDISVPNIEFHNFVAEGIVVHNSWTLGVYVEELNKVGTQFVLFDPVSAHSSIELPNLIHIAVKKGSTLKVKKLIDNLKHTNNSYVIDLSRLKLKSQQKIINKYCEEMIDAKIGNRIKKVIVTAFEECQDFVPQRRKTPCSANMIRFLKLGRQMGYGSVLLSQRATSIDKNALTQTAVYLIHQLSNYADIDNLKKQLGIAVDREGMKKIMRKIIKFEPGEVLCVSPAYISGVGALITKIRQRRTKHAGKNVIESQRKRPAITSPTMPGFNTYMDQKDAGGVEGQKIMASNAEDEFEMDDEDDEDMTDTRETIKTGNKRDLPSYTKPVMIMLCSVGVIGIGWVTLSRYMNKQKKHIDREKDDRYERSLRLREREIRKKEKEKFDAELGKIEEEMKEKEKKKNAGSMFDQMMNIPGNEDSSPIDAIPPGIEIGPDEAYGLREKYKRWFSQ